jgi:hypothetical protein
MYLDLLFSNFSKITEKKCILININLSGILDKFDVKVRKAFLLNLFVNVIIAFFALNSFAQNARELEVSIAAMKSSIDVTTKFKGVHLDSLAHQVQPTIYIQNGLEKVFGDRLPVCTDIDVQSIGKLNELNPLFNKVELLTITLNSNDDLNFVLDFSTLSSSFVSLKYLRFYCLFKVDPLSINNLFLNASEKGITVFYVIPIRG